MLSVSLSVGGGVFACLANGAVETTTPLSFGVYLLGKHLLNACCLWTGVQKMSSSQSMAPGGSCSGRGHLTGNRRARKPLGKRAVGEELAPDGCGPRAASLASALQNPSEGHMSWEELALKGGK